MRALDAFLVVLCLATLAYSVNRDLAEYASFKLFTETADRQRKYLVWTAQGFLQFSCATIFCLAIIGRLRAVLTLPPEFSTLSHLLQPKVPSSQLPDSGFMYIFGGAIIGGIIGGILLQPLLKKMSKRNATGKPDDGPIVIGDIQALMPRNGAETLCTALLSLNAGLGEELFFRLLLPLLLTLVTGNAIAAFVFAAVVFGLAHIYQGAAGVIATTILGLAFTALYLWTGSLWIVICAHAGLDLIGLVVRPTITRALTARRNRQRS